MEDLIITNARIVDGTGAPAYRGDITVNDGVITAVGASSGQARRVIDAEGHLVTPGFVDIHTHFDGQVCWDKQLTPSSWHGVTTVVMGNCGVGFAPVRPGAQDELIELMESVEDIPGTALHEGIPWGWESFAEYLDVIDTPYTVDIGTQVPHVALRHYVMGERCHEDATAEDILAMSEITRQALSDGALGFSTSRFYGHRDKHGQVVPGTYAGVAEMMGFADAVADAGHGTMEIISDHLDDEDELGWIEAVARRAARPVTVLATADFGDGIWGLAERMAADGVEVRPQVGARPPSVLMTLEGSLNPMRQFPHYRTIASLPIDEQRTKLRDPEFRAAILADEARGHRFPEVNRITSTWDRMYVLDPSLTYEPDRPDSVAGLAETRGLDVREVLMDTLADGIPILHLFGNYPGHLENQRNMIENEVSVFGLSDGGAHCTVLCDAGVPTYMLAYMTRDRERGPKLNLERTVHKMTQDTARLYGLFDRGVIAPGMRADLNIIDYDALRLHAPEMVNDLPAGGQRLIQRADGYVATICAGEVTYENGEHTGAMPGRLIRGGR